ncbi:OLC1v1019736C1 [Oldenlandia corymbosa var. corymbosa]|uniref:OLC1v1019736C1 n=1 Tax=Oldenlandia corymbosa var. corymbosa TaxID=529605 RepID=A0AAV1EF63_OLDCO|nr:OLC1v1019736C1 [Oldenlandia corymbosa var. corymbosa]
MATINRLLGPPELYQGSSPPLLAAASGETIIPATEKPNLDDVISMLKTQLEIEIAKLKSQASTLDVDDDDDSDGGNHHQHPFMGLTENLSATFLSSGNPCLDFFFHVVPNTPREDLVRRLELAWAHDPLMALKLICNLRGVRGTGKSDKEGFYAAAFWLYCFHPKTLACNVKAIAEFGYFKDFLEILYRILEGPLIRVTEKEARKTEREEKFRKFITNLEEQEEFTEWVFHGRRGRGRRNRGRGNDEAESGKKRDKVVKDLEEIQKRNREEKEKARAMRKERELNKAKKALEKYNGDGNYRLLHDGISDFFAELLKADLEKLSAEKNNEISLAAKWCPTVDSSYDKATLICESIARKLFPKEKYSEYEGVEESHYVYKVRDRLRKEVLVPLHKALELPEVYMSANQWNSLPYKRVASVAMKTYKELFKKHDEERFAKYLEDVKSGKAKIAAGALLPHEIIKSLEDSDGGEVAELQWKRMVEDMVAKGKLSYCIAVCDVSGSMSGIPMEVSVALGVLVSELSEEPWKGKLITFSENPELQKVEGETLLEKTQFVRDMAWGMSTNFQGVFDRILEVATKANLKEEQLIKRVFVFSDMEFNRASANPWETDYQAIQRKFRENGYQTVPEIVFWNLRDSRSTPVTANQSGVALVSGFSKNLLTMFLDGDGIVNPAEVMELAIAGEEYKKLAVCD